MIIFRNIVVGFLTLLLGALPSYAAHAQSPEIKAAREQVEKSAEAAPETVESLRSALVSVLELTATELTEALAPDKIDLLINRADAALATDAADLKKLLIMYQGYVSLVTAQAARESNTVENIKDIAAAFKEWREEAYVPALRELFNLLLVAQGGDVLVTAERRLEKVDADVKKLQASVGRSAASLLPLLEEARGHLEKAADLRTQARELLIKEHEQFLSNTYEELPNGPHWVVLRRGALGDFTCLPTTRASSCQLGFKTADNGYYAFKTASGAPALYAPGDIAQVTGTLLKLEPVLPGDVVAGVFYIDTVNLVEPKAPSASIQISGTASALDAVASEPSTIQTLIKGMIVEVSATYKIFLAMSKLAKALSVK